MSPKCNGFWSLTLYNAEHFFHPNSLKRYSLGTKNKNPKRNAAGSLYIRAYWGKQGILDGSWQPPAIKRVR